MPQRTLIRRYYNGLDGLRAVAFLLVYCNHITAPSMPAFFTSNASPFAWGWVGVDLFFVLSGFLITGILYDSLDTKDFFKSFYIRRSLRIFPLYFGFWLLLLTATPVLHVAWNRYLISTVLYLGNLFVPGAVLGLHANPMVIPLGRHHGVQLGVGHFWSLCVEEQFYLVWPAIVWFVRSRAALLRICLGYMVAAPLLRTAILIAFPWARATHALYLLTPFRLDTILAGAALALWLRETDFGRDAIVRLAHITLSIAATAFVICLFFARQAHGPTPTCLQQRPSALR